MVNNGSLHYDHDRDGTHTQLAGCEAKFRNLDHDSYVAIRYEDDKLTGKIFESGVVFGFDYQAFSFSIPCYLSLCF